MADNKPFDFLTVPKIYPEKKVGDFLQSKRETQIKNAPTIIWDIPRQAPIINLVQQRRKLHNAELQLQEKQQINVEQNKQLHQQWKEFEEKIKNFRQTVTDFDEKVKQNSEKRKRTKKQILKQTAANKQKETTNEKLACQLKEMEELKNYFETNIPHCTIYEDYLKSVMEIREEYTSVSDIFNHFDSLSFARNLGMKNIQNNIQELENLKTKLLQQNMQQNVKLNGIKNQIVNLHNRYRNAKVRVQEWEQNVKTIQVILREKILEIFKTKSACNNIYTLMCARKKIKPQFNKDDFKNQLWFIKINMLKLKKTLEIANRKSIENCSSTQVELPLYLKKKKF